MKPVQSLRDHLPWIRGVRENTEEGAKNERGCTREKRPEQSALEACRAAIRCAERSVPGAEQAPKPRP